MLKKLKLLLAISLIAVSVLSTTACTSGGNEDLITSEKENEEKEKEEKTKIVFLRCGTEESKKEAFTKMIEAFEEKYSNIEVEYQESPFGDDLETKLNTGYAAGTAPDVINNALASIGLRVGLGQYGALDEYVTEATGLDDYYDSAIAAGSKDGKLYGIANYADARMLVYNKELFEKAGLDPEKPPTNWEELKEYHEKLIVKDESGNVVQTGFTFATSGHGLEQTLMYFAMQNGVPSLLDDETGEILFTSPETIEAAEFLDELNEMGNIKWDTTKADTNPFGKGIAAMAVMSENEFKQFNTGELEGKLAMAPMFSNKEEGIFCGMHFMFMNAESKHKEEAWKLIEFLTSEEMTKIWCDTVGAVPMRESLSEDYVASNPNGEIILKSVEIGKGLPRVSYSATMSSILVDALEEVYYGEAEPKEALEKAATELQEVIDNQ